MSNKRAYTFGDAFPHGGLIKPAGFLQRKHQITVYVEPHDENDVYVMLSDLTMPWENAPMERFQLEIMDVMAPTWFKLSDIEHYDDDPDGVIEAWVYTSDSGGVICRIYNV